MSVLTAYSYFVLFLFTYSCYNAGVCKDKVKNNAWNVPRDEPFVERKRKPVSVSISDTEKICARTGDSRRFFCGIQN